MDLLELAARVEAGGRDDQRVQLLKAWHAINDDRLQQGDQARADYFREQARLVTMLDAKAYESAAMMLMPKGWWFRMTVGRGAAVTAWLMGQKVASDATTPALAIAAAALKARAS